MDEKSNPKAGQESAGLRAEFDLLLAQRKQIKATLDKLPEADRSVHAAKLDELDKRLTVLQARVGTYKVCSRCKGSLVQPILAGGVKPAAGQNAYWCRECNLSWRGDGRVLVEGVTEVRNVFAGATEGRAFLREVLEKSGGEPLSVEMQAVIETSMVEHYTRVWFDGWKTGQLALLEHLAYVNGKTRTGQGNAEGEHRSAPERTANDGEDGVGGRGAAVSPGEAGRAHKVADVQVFVPRGLKVDDAMWERIALQIADCKDKVLGGQLKQNGVLVLDIQREVAVQ